MKALSFSIYTILFSTSLFAQSGAIALPEMSILYKGWNNKIVPMIPCNEELILELDGASATAAEWTDSDGNTFKGYHVNVTSPSKYVTIRVKGKSENGTIQNHGSFRYRVKPFPTAQLQGTTISKTVGYKAIVSLGPDSPFTGVSFNVLGGSIVMGNDEYNFVGDRIPASLIENIQPGKRVAINVTYKRDGGNPSIASGVLMVVP